MIFMKTLDKILLTTAAGLFILNSALAVKYLNSRKVEKEIVSELKEEANEKIGYFEKLEIDPTGSHHSMKWNTLVYKEIIIKEGDSLPKYLAKEGHPIDLDTYVLLVKMGNKDNKKAFVNYDGGKIRVGKRIYLPDLDKDGRVAGRH